MPVLTPPTNRRPLARDEASTLQWSLAQQSRNGNGTLQLEIPVLGPRLAGWVGAHLARQVTERYLDLDIGATVIALTSTKPQGQRLIIIATPTGHARRPLHTALLQTLVDDTLTRLPTTP